MGNDECTIYSDNANVGDGHTICGSQKPECDGYPTGCSILGKFSMRRLDDVLAEQNVPNVDFVKMDTEGYECMVMQGAPTLLTKFRPRLIKSEVWSDESDCHGGAEGFLDMFTSGKAYKVSKTLGCNKAQPWNSTEGHIQDYYMCREGPGRRVPLFFEQAKVSPPPFETLLCFFFVACLFSAPQVRAQIRHSASRTQDGCRCNLESRSML